MPRIRKSPPLEESRRSPGRVPWYVWVLLPLLLLFVMYLLSGTSSVPGDRTPPAASGAASVEITPLVATRSSIFTPAVTGFNLADAELEWLVNGNTMRTANPHQFSAGEAQRGDRIQVRARVGGREILSNIVTIGNEPPVITNARFLPEVLKAGDVLRVEATAVDPEGDPVTISYAWLRNGQPAGADSSIDGLVRRGDRIMVRIMPSDGMDSGKTTILEMEVRNMPPQVQMHKEFTFDGSLYTYQVRASDPDGDALTFAIESPVPDMQIDPATGLLTWNVPREFKGRKSVALTVSDGNKGTARQTLEIIIQ